MNAQSKIVSDPSNLDKDQTIDKEQTRHKSF